MSDIIFTDTQRAVNQTKGREEMGREKPTIKNNLTNAIKTDLHFKEDMICFDKNRKELIKLANDEIAEWQKFREELETKSDAEIVKGIADKKPIKIKGEKWINKKCWIL